MQRTPVSSSNVLSVGWEVPPADPEAGDDPRDTQTGTLEVEFRSGHIYQYFNVPAQVAEDLLGATSVGRTLNATVIGRFEEQRIR